ncbi:MAG: hypothetical protein K2M80_00290 [Muribaculaceae bacterium]|nr:hypothetical protein [Muribaculaceae bacterium]
MFNHYLMFNRYLTKPLICSALCFAITSCSSSKKVMEQSDLNFSEHQSLNVFSTSLLTGDFSAASIIAELRADSVVITRPDSIQIVAYQPSFSRRIDSPDISVAACQSDSTASNVVSTLRQSANSVTERKPTSSITSSLKLILAIAVLIGIIKILRKLFS